MPTSIRERAARRGRMAISISNVAFLSLAPGDARGLLFDVTDHSKEPITMQITMPTVPLFARLEAKPGKQDALHAFLKQGLALANQEPTTPVWFALRLTPTTFAIFDAFADESGRQ